VCVDDFLELLDQGNFKRLLKVYRHP